MRNVRSIMHTICGKGKRWQQTHKIMWRVTHHRRQLGMRAYVKWSHGNALQKPALDKRSTIDCNKEICEHKTGLLLDISHFEKNWSVGFFRYRRDLEIKIPAISQLLLLNNSLHHRHPHERNKALSPKISSLKFQCVLLHLFHVVPQTRCPQRIYLKLFGRKFCQFISCDLSNYSDIMLYLPK